MKLDINRKRLEVMAWADEHNWVIDPFKGMDFHIEDFFKTGYCPCDKTKSRTSCPCPQSIDDIATTGKCLCGLFWDRGAIISRIMKYIDDKERDEQVCSKADKGVRGAGASVPS